MSNQSPESLTQYHEDLQVLRSNLDYLPGPSCTEFVTDGVGRSFEKLARQARGLDAGECLGSQARWSGTNRPRYADLFLLTGQLLAEFHRKYPDAS